MQRNIGNAGQRLALKITLPDTVRIEERIWHSQKRPTRMLWQYCLVDTRGRQKLSASGATLDQSPGNILVRAAHQQELLFTGLGAADTHMSTAHGCQRSNSRL